MFGFLFSALYGDKSPTNPERVFSATYEVVPDTKRGPGNPSNSHADRKPGDSCADFVLQAIGRNGAQFLGSKLPHRR